MKKMRKKFELTDNQKFNMVFFIIVLSFVFLMISFFFVLEKNYLVFTIFLVISLWLFFNGMLINLTKQIIKSVTYVTALFVLMLLPFCVTVPFIINTSQNLYVWILIDLLVSIISVCCFVFLVKKVPENRKIKFLLSCQNYIRHSKEMQSIFFDISFNALGDRATILPINNNKFFLQVEKLQSEGFYEKKTEIIKSNLLDAKVASAKELLALLQEDRPYLTLNTDLPKNEKLKKLMLFFNEKLLSDGFADFFMLNPKFSSYYKSEFIYLVNKNDKAMSVEFHVELNDIFFCLLGSCELIEKEETFENLYEIIKLILQGQLIYLPDMKKIRKTKKLIYKVYDLRKILSYPLMVRCKLIFAKNAKTWTKISVKEYISKQRKLKRYLHDVNSYINPLNEKLKNNGFTEHFVCKYKLFKGKIRPCLNVSSANELKQADIFIVGNSFYFKFIFSQISASILLDFESNVQTIFDIVLQLFLDKVVFHYKTTNAGRMIERGMFLLDKNNEYKNEIIFYITNNPSLTLMVWSEKDKSLITSQIQDIFKA